MFLNVLENIILTFSIHFKQVIPIPTDDDFSIFCTLNFRHFTVGKSATNYLINKMSLAVLATAMRYTAV